MERLTCLYCNWPIAADLVTGDQFVVLAGPDEFFAGAHIVCQRVAEMLASQALLERSALTDIRPSKTA